MKKTIINIRDSLLIAKMYIMRSASYVSLINLGMIMFLTILKLKELGFFNFDISSYIVPIYFITLFLLMIFGYIDIKILKGYNSEVHIMNKVTPLHPELAELKKKVDYLYELEINKFQGVKDEN